jgi:hypothetical protein
MHAEDEMGSILLEHLDVIGFAEMHRAPVDVTQKLNHRIKTRVQKRRMLLDPIVEAHSAAIEDRGLLEHLLDAHIHIMLVELEAPLCKGLGPGVMAAAGA